MTRVAAQWRPMSRLARSLVVSGIPLLLLAGATGSVVDGGAMDAARASAGEAVARAPLAFRSDGGSGFEARLPGYGVAVSAGGATVSGAGGGPPLRLRLDGARPDAAAAGRVPLPGRVNLFLGDDPSQWRTDVPTYGQAAYTGVWEGIDVVWYGKGPHLEHDFVVAPGADPDRIAISFPDGHDLSVTGDGDLVVQLPAGRARLGAPTVYQTVGDRQRPVSGSYVIREGGQVGFRVGPHDRARPLVIDPVLLDSTFLGGGGNDAAYGVAVDDAGSVYVSGSTESPDFPVTAPVQAFLVQGDGPRSDAFVAKLNPDGSGFAYSTFLGGRARDVAYGIALGRDGSAYVSGSTESTDFPLARPVQKAYGGGGTDAFVSKLSPQGAVLQYSTYLGGTGADSSRGIGADPAGNAYLTGTTTSNDFPTAGPPLQPTPSKPDDTAAFVTKVNATGDAWAYSTYLGGTGDDHGTAIAVAATGDVFVVGDTRSPDFPVARPFQPRAGAPPGPTTVPPDAFVVKLPAAGAPVTYSTYLGGFESDMATGVDIDASGAAYVTGSTGSSNFPLVQAVQINKRGEYDAFVSKLNPAGSALMYSTFLGGSDSDGAAAITVADDGGASVTGTVASNDFPTVKPFQAAKGGGFIDGFVASYTPSGSAVTQASFFGGRDDDQGTAIAARGSGTLYVAGYTGSPDFPVVNPLRPTRGGAGDAFVARVGEPPVGASSDTSGAPARERRLRIFGAITAVLFLGAIAQTLWLRRRSAPDEPAPVPVGAAVGTPAIAAAGTPAGDRSGHWYKQTPPNFSDLPPLRPRAVPSSGRSKSASPESDVDGDVAVPDLLPADKEEKWTRATAPADADASTGEDSPWADAAAGAQAIPPMDVQAPDLWGPTDAEEAVAVDPGPPDPRPAGAKPPLSVDVRAPDLWEAAESPREDLADDPMWAELLAAEAAPASRHGPAGSEAPQPGAGRAKAESAKAESAKAEAAQAEAPALEPATTEAADAEAAELEPATTEAADASPEPVSKGRRRKPAAPAEPVPATTGASADGDWMAELWVERPEDQPVPAADETSPDAGGPHVPAEAVNAGAGVEVDRSSEPAATPERKPLGWLARRRAATQDRDSGRAPGDAVAGTSDVGLDTAEVLAAPPPIAPQAAETQPAAASSAPAPGEPDLAPVQEATTDAAGTETEPASSPVVPPPGRAASPTGKRSAGKRSAGKRAAAEAPDAEAQATKTPDAAKVPGIEAPDAETQATKTPDAAKTPGIDPPTPKPAATKAPAAKKPAAKRPAAKAQAAKMPAAKAPAIEPPAPKAAAPTPAAAPETPAMPAPAEAPAATPPPPEPPVARPVTPTRPPAARPTLPPPTEPVAPGPLPAGARVLPPAGDPFAPAPMRPTTSPTEAPAAAPPPGRSRRRTARGSGARLATPPLPPPPPEPAPDLERLAVPDQERDVVEAGLADLVGNVELADLPAEALAEGPPIGDPPAGDAAAPDAGAGDDPSDGEPPAEDPASQSYPALPEAAPGRWRGLRPRRD